MPEPPLRQKVWRHPKRLSEHAFDKLRLLDCTFGEFDELLARADIIEEHQLPSGELKEVLLLLDWRLPLHVVVVVDEGRREERVVTVYEPDRSQWAADYRRRR